MIKSQRWSDQAARALTERLDGIVKEAVSELRVRVPEYLRALVAAGEDPRSVCQGTIGLLVGALRSNDAVVTAGSALRRVGQARCESGVALDTLLEAISIQRDLLGRQLEVIGLQTPAVDADLRVADRRLEHATTSLTAALTQGYMDAIRERGQRQRATAEAMVRVAAAVNQSLERGEVAQAALDTMTEALGVDAGLLWLKVDGELALAYTVGLRWTEETLIRAADRAGTLPLLARARRAAKAVDGSSLAPGGRPILRAAIAVALRSRGDLLGILVAGCRRERAFDSGALAFASGAADHLASALVRAERHRREALTDHLTGLANRTEFERQLEAMVASAQRHHRPLALALFDLDGLKQINDRLGHPAGDRVLRTVGRALLLNVRSTDTCARIGGDEFAIAMPETHEMHADEVVRRVGEEIAAHDLHLSAGVVAWMPGMSALQLFERADAVLYRDKRRHHRGRESAG